MYLPHATYSHKDASICSISCFRLARAGTTEASEMEKEMGV
jgi:hypothetical protein